VTHPNFSGTWIVNAGRSSSLKALLRALGADGWAASLAAGVDVTYHIFQGPADVTITETSSLGRFEQRFILDGKWRTTPMHAGGVREAKARENEGNGDVVIEVELPARRGVVPRKRLDRNEDDGEEGGGVVSGGGTDATHHLMPAPGQDDHSHGKRVLVDQRSLIDRGTMTQLLLLIDEDGEVQEVCSRVLRRLESDAERAAGRATATGSRRAV